MYKSKNLTNQIMMDMKTESLIFGNIKLKSRDIHQKFISFNKSPIKMAYIVAVSFFVFKKVITQNVIGLSLSYSPEIIQAIMEH